MYAWTYSIVIDVLASMPRIAETLADGKPNNEADDMTLFLLRMRTYGFESIGFAHQ